MNMETGKEIFEKPKEIKKNEKALSIKFLLALMVVAIVASSFFGALFGFFSAGIVSVLSPKFEQKIGEYLPMFKSESLNPVVSRQQVIIEDSAVIDVVEKSSIAVVSIIVSKDVASSMNPFFFNPFFGFENGDENNDDNGEQKQQIGAGSGFFITSDGLILTNKHVVSDKQAEYKVITNDGKEYVAKVLTQDPVRDVAVIKVEGNDFPVLPLGNSDSLKIGQTTIAIGNSLGEFSNSVSRGIVSGLKRNVNAGSRVGETERLTDIIQTDAAINPGNSGGPLLDIEGNVIGINVATAQGAQNVGFALPVNQVKRIIDQVEKGVRVTVPYLGVRYIAVDSIVQREAQLPFDYGVLVMRGNKLTDFAVIPGSPADIAGINENDIILEINGEKITKDNQLGDMIVKYEVGDEIALKIWHKGQTKDVKVKLQELKQ